MSIVARWYFKCAARNVACVVPISFVLLCKLASVIVCLAKQGVCYGPHWPRSIGAIDDLLSVRPVAVTGSKICLHRISRVRHWPKATFPFALRMSAYDPKRTYAGAAAEYRTQCTSVGLGAFFPRSSYSWILFRKVRTEIPNSFAALVRLPR